MTAEETKKDKNIMNTITLSRLQRPTFDPFTGQEYKGNHRDLIISRKRNGDNVVESTAWKQDNGHFVYRSERSFSVSAMVGMAESHGVKVDDDIPQGVSLVD